MSFKNNIDLVTAHCILLSCIIQAYSNSLYNSNTIRVWVAQLTTRTISSFQAALKHTLDSAWFHQFRLQQQQQNTWNKLDASLLELTPNDLVFAVYKKFCAPLRTWASLARHWIQFFFVDSAFYRLYLGFVQWRSLFVLFVCSFRHMFLMTFIVYSNTTFSLVYVYAFIVLSQINSDIDLWVIGLTDCCYHVCGILFSVPVFDVKFVCQSWHQSWVPFHGAKPHSFSFKWKRPNKL